MIMMMMCTQISLYTHAVWSEYPLSAWRDSASLAIQTAPSKHSDQTACQPCLLIRWDPCQVWQYSLMETDHDIFSKAILPTYTTTSL